MRTYCGVVLDPELEPLEAPRFLCLPWFADEVVLLLASVPDVPLVPAVSPLAPAVVPLPPPAPAEPLVPLPPEPVVPAVSLLPDAVPVPVAVVLAPALVEPDPHCPLAEVPVPLPGVLDWPPLLLLLLHATANASAIASKAVEQSLFIRISSLGQFRE